MIRRWPPADPTTTITRPRPLRGHPTLAPSAGNGLAASHQIEASAVTTLTYTGPSVQGPSAFLWRLRRQSMPTRGEGSRKSSLGLW